MPKLIFLGHAAFVIEGDQGKIAIDPFLTDNPIAKAKPEDIQVDAVLVTHGHGDHVGDTVPIAKKNDALVVAPFELANFLGNQGVSVHPMHIGGSKEFPFAWVKLTTASHGSAYVDDEKMVYTGNPCGFLITMDGKTLYHPGDTGLFYDMKLIGEMNVIDVAVLPIGDNFTMGIEDAVKAAEFLRPKLVIPMHYKTFEVINVEPEDFVKAATAKGIHAKVLPIGDTLEY